MKEFFIYFWWWRHCVTLSPSRMLALSSQHTCEENKGWDKIISASELFNKLLECNRVNININRGGLTLHQSFLCIIHHQYFNINNNIESRWMHSYAMCHAMLFLTAPLLGNEWWCTGTVTTLRDITSNAWDAKHASCKIMAQLPHTMSIHTIHHNTRV